MYVLIGVLFIAGLILLTLYQFVFSKFHKIIGFVLLFAVSFMLIFTGFMHMIISAIKIAEQNKTKRNNA
jgi:predicted membrane protein